MISYQVLQPSQTTAYGSLTFPAYRHLLQPRPPAAGGGVGSLALGASLFGRPQGLALAGLPPPGAGEDPRLLSLYVQPAARRQGVGTALLEHLQGALGERGYARVTTSYIAGRPSIPFLERALARAGWEPPSIRALNLRFSRDEARRVPWFQKYELGPGFETFPWADLGAAERQRLRRSQEETGWIAKDLEPWRHDAGIEPFLSLGLKRHGEVVGWVLYHAIAADTVRMTCVYVRRDLQRLGKILPVFSESLDRLQRTPYVWVTAVSRMQHPRMHNFFRRWCGPWASFLEECRETEKRLVAGGRGAPRPEAVR
jgi:GNAT superfamily N-acetyltransferase